MFFMIGITQGRKDLEYHQTVECDLCGAYGRFNVFMTYTSLLLFLIPVAKWDRHYYVQMSCCGAIYELDPEIGKAIAEGRQILIQERDLTLLRDSQGRNAFKKCKNCGYETAEDFVYCPKCGHRL